MAPPEGPEESMASESENRPISTIVILIGELNPIRCNWSAGIHACTISLGYWLILLFWILYPSYADWSASSREQVPA